MGGDQFQPDRASEALVGKTGIRNLAAAAGQELTYICVPPDADGDALAWAAARRRRAQPRSRAA